MSQPRNKNGVNTNASEFSNIDLASIWSVLESILNASGGTPVLAPVRNTSGSKVGEQISGVPAKLWSINISNLADTTIFVKIYDVPNPDHTSEPISTLMVPLGSQQPIFPSIPICEGDVLWFRCVTGMDDTDDTDPSTSPIVEIQIETT